MLVLLLAAPPGGWAQTAGPPPPPPPPPGAPPAPPPEVLPQGALDQLLAPIALYPDALLAQVLMASTYPLEIVQAARWQRDNPALTGAALEAALQPLPWDPSVKSLVAFPQVLTMMNDKLDWTQQLGDAFLAQEQAVMATVQQLRAKAQAAGYLKSTPEQQVIVEQQIIQVVPANPTVVYVPTYNPTVVYGVWPYPAYPPYYYYPPGYVAAASVFSFGVGLAVGAALWGGCNWGRGTVNINVNRYNQYNRTTISNTNWSHNSVHRGAVPYRDEATRQQYGRGPQPGASTREAYRGRTEPGRPQQLPGGSPQRPAATPTTGGQRPAPSQRPAGVTGASPSQRPAPSQLPTAAPGASPSLRPTSGGTGTFEGVGRSGDTKQWSSRGQASRQTSPQPSPQQPRSGSGMSGGNRPSGGGGGGQRPAPSQRPAGGGQNRQRP